MLPNANYSPPILFKDFRVATITLDVLSNLRLPVGAIPRRKRAVLRAAMPEASVDEYGDFAAREDEIRTDLAAPTWLDRKVDSIPETRGMRGFPDRLLGASVAATVGAHDLASCLRDISPAAGSRRLTLL